jgi:hypothetical protein
MRAYEVWRRGITAVSVLTLVATLTGNTALAHPLLAEDVIVLPPMPASETTSSTTPATAPVTRVEPPAAAPSSPIYVLQVQPGASVTLPGGAAASGAPAATGPGLVANDPSQAAAPSSPVYVLQVQPGASVTLPGGAPAQTPGPTREPGIIASSAPPPAAASTLPSQTLAPSSGSPAYVSGGLAEQAQQVSTTPGRRDAASRSLPDRIAPLDAAQLSRSAGMRPDNANCGGLGPCAWPNQDTSGNSCTPDTRSCTSTGTSPLATTMMCTGSGALRTCEDPAAGSTASSVTPYAYPATNSSAYSPVVSPNAVSSLGYICTNNTSLMAPSTSATGLPLASTACPVLR